MRSSCVTASLVLGLAIPVLGATPAAADQPNRTLTGEVVDPIDGDSLLVDLDRGPVVEVRLIGVAAPEGGACYAKESAAYAEDLLEDEDVELVIERRHEPRGDERLFAYVYVDGEHINRKMIDEGYAKERDYGGDYDLRSEFVEAEEEAREDREGLWGDCRS